MGHYGELLFIKIIRFKRKILSPSAMFTSVKFSPVCLTLAAFNTTRGYRAGGDLGLEPVGGHQTVFLCLHHLLLPKSWDKSEVRRVVLPGSQTELEKVT